MSLSPLVSGLLAILMFIAGFFQLLTIKCVPTKELRATKAVMAGGFLILSWYFLDVLMKDYEWVSVHIVCFALVLIAIASIVGNIGRVIDRLERKKHETNITT